jgi:transcriptional regulator of aromatic amino acid metabolism
MRSITPTFSSQRDDVEDEVLAVSHRLPLLITARCASSVTTVARRIHVAAFTPGAPFVAFPGAELLELRWQFDEQWMLLMQAGQGGTVLITDVEKMPDAAQGHFANSLAELRACRSRDTARLITGTTVSLLDRVKAGQFSDALLYRLNVVHLHRREGCDPCPDCAART